MKTSHSLVLFLFVAILIQSCTSTKSTTSKTSVVNNDFYLFQNGKETVIDEMEQTIEVDRRAFSIRFYNKKYDPNANEFYAARIAALLDKAELDNVKEGMLMEDVPYFREGTGMASNESGKYENLVFKNNANHFTFYENPESNRLNLINESGGILKLEFEISQLDYGNMKVKMNETNLNEFYLAIFIDRNLNRQIDKGELKKLTVKIK